METVENKTKIFKEFLRENMNEDKLQKRKHYTENGDYYFNNMKNLRKRYGGKFVVIFDEKVIIVATKIVDLSDKLSNKLKREDQE